jgi:hypothetical protein
VHAVPSLKNLLLANPHPHPLIYLRGVKQHELQSILRFIYLGEARLYESNIELFMEASKDLQIKQLAAGNPFLLSKERADEENRSSRTSDTGKITNIEFDSQMYKCEECGAVFKTKSGLWFHTKSKHECIVYSCDQCEFEAT